MMEAKKKYEKPAFRLVTDLGSILECLYEVYGTDGTMLIAGNKLSLQNWCYCINYGWLIERKLCLH